MKTTYYVYVVTPKMVNNSQTYLVVNSNTQQTVSAWFSSMDAYKTSKDLNMWYNRKLLIQGMVVLS